MLKSPDAVMPFLTMSDNVPKRDTAETSNTGTPVAGQARSRQTADVVRDTMDAAA